MRVLNYGSLNIDHVYRVAHFVRPGETLNSDGYARHGGGKGANQSIALAFAGADVAHAGKVGRDGLWLKEHLAACGVDTTHVAVVDEPGGHAVIQVSPAGENAIVLSGGANRSITAGEAERVLDCFSAGDWVLLQNEISAIPDIMRLADARGLHVAFNPAPMAAEVLDYPLDCVSLLVVNELEAAGLSGENVPGNVLPALRQRFPRAAVVMTLGARGAAYADANVTLSVPAERVKAVDTTAAGDTFIGYFLAERLAGHDVEPCLRTACRAAAICVTVAGAQDSIPRRDRLESVPVVSKV